MDEILDEKLYSSVWWCGVNVAVEEIHQKFFF
jgi:hypothetical protein